jgi:large repetitive protein
VRLIARASQQTTGVDRVTHHPNLAAAALGAALLLAAGPPAAQSFTPVPVPGLGLTNPTSLQFGPDGRLYVSEQLGAIKVYTLARGASSYVASRTELIDRIRHGVPNHDDDGSACSADCNRRQVTGLLVTGTASQPVLYVSSSDSRIAVNADSGLDTNSGVVSRLTCTGGVVDGQCLQWDHVDIVRGLPRSEENHAVNGMSLDADASLLYLAVGGNANMGAPSSAFSGTPEYYLAGAILAIDLAAIAAIEAAHGGAFTDPRNGSRFVYDLPTLDDPSRPNIDASHPDFPYPVGHPWRDRSIDPGDPFGGNNGLNQAIVEPGGPVRIHSPGYRNPYDVLLTRDGTLYTWDNGPNSGWGGTPFVYDDSGTRKGWYGQPGVVYDPDAGDWCSNEYNESGSATIGDVLKRIDAPGYYGGHPAPIRAFPARSGIRVYVKSETGHWVQEGPTRQFADLLPAGFGLAPADFPADPRQCRYALTDGALEIISHSTNGLAEYTASAFGGAMQGDLLAASFNGNVYRCKPDGAGGLVDLPGASTGAANGLCEVLFSGLGAIPLDVTTQDDDGPFPGTIWVALYLGGVQAYEPAAPPPCDPLAPGAPQDDADGDGYTNADELDNATDPCNAGSVPPDFDGDYISDLNDPDDDNDGIDDVDDPFALDPYNGLQTTLPLHYPLFNNDPGTGLFGLGFTGLMLPRNGSDSWLELFDGTQLAAGGAAGRLTVEAVDGGTAVGGGNSQRNGFLFGVAVDVDTPPFSVRTRLVPPYFGDGGATGVPSPGQGYGLFIGRGDQDNFLMLAIDAGGIGLTLEAAGATTSTQFGAEYWAGQTLLASSSIDLVLEVDPQAATAQARVALDGSAMRHALGTPVAIPAEWFDPLDDQGLAIGTIATAAAGASYAATWDLFEVDYTATGAAGDWNLVAAGDQVRHENAFVQAGLHFLMLGGRESNLVRRYDPQSGNWSAGAAAPIRLHHFQAVVLHGLVYVVGAMTGNCCDEPPVTHVHIYDPQADRWILGPEIPESRRRGGGGAIAVGDAIYWVSGNTRGHYGPVSAQVDRFDPATGVFTPLADIPNPRDHFFVEHHAGKLYAVAGRDSNYAEDGDVFDDTITAVDIYDITAGSWSTLPSGSDLPTPRAGAITGIIGNDLIVAGGESSASADAHPQTEALDLQSHAWRPLADMRTPRHGTQGLVSNNGLYVAAGSGRRGGPTSTPLALEVLHLFGHTPPAGSAIVPGSLSAPATFDFGTVAVGNAEERTLLLDNNGGNQALVVESLLVDGADFVLLGPTLPVAVAPGASVAVRLGFAPQAAGPRSGSLQVVASAGPARTVALAGVGGDGEPAPDTVFRDGFEG